MIPNLEKDPTGTAFLKQNGLHKLGFYEGKLDNDWGPESQTAERAYRDSLVAVNKGLLTGDGTWPFSARIIGDDIVCENIMVTCFGGWGGGSNADPQDNGETASGRNTKNEAIEGVSIAMDSRLFPNMEDRDPDGFRALKGAPFPKLPWGTPVEVNIGGQLFTPKDGIVDLGPGKHASKPGEPHALDLTPIAARHFKPGTPLRRLAIGFSARGSFRIIGGAKFVAA